MRQFAPAKVNLALHVTGRRVDGYHLLDSLVVFAGVGDWVQADAADALSLTVTGPRAEGVPTDAGNLMWRAAQLLGRPAALTLEKHLPHAGGIGGGSADAAATLRAVQALYDLPPLDPAATLALGADLPVCYIGRPSRMSGIGDIVEDIPSLPPLWCVLANAGVAVPTGPVFQALTRVDHPPLPAPDWTDTASLFAWLSATRNDLEGPATTLVPEIGTTLQALAATRDCRLARMSGSGGTCFGLFDTQAAAEAAASILTDAHPTWWVAATPILGQPGPNGPN